MLTIKIKPINEWIGAETKSPKRSQFSATYKKTKQLLESELSFFNLVSSSVQLEMFIRAEDLRQDGELRANAKPYKQGVVLSFTIITRRLQNKATGEIRNETKALSYPCDTFDDWQDNLRGIALSLQNLRAVSRYGVFKYEDMVERLALPSAEGKTATVQTAAEFVAQYSDYPPHAMGDKTFLEKAYRQAAGVLHPDKETGSHDLFLRLQKAKEVLDK